MEKFDILETTIAKVHQAMLEGDLTARELVESYLERIETYDNKLHSIILVNPNALAEADHLDKQLAETKELIGPLHGIPVMLKDNVDTYDMVTTAGSSSLEDNQPKEDAFITKKLRDAGAIILAKTNLHEFAIWGETLSSVLGQTLNPYDPTRTPGGSSGGTGASMAANFGLIGIGTDTINSIRSPASACSLVGFRPTIGLVSRTGIIPYSLTQDTAGPICRTVEDAVRTLEVIQGYDKHDPVTAKSVGGGNKDYRTHLKTDGLQGKRIGVLESFFGDKEENLGVNKQVKEATRYLEEGGATLVSIDEEIDSDWIVKEVSVHLDDFKTHVGSYLGELPEDYPVHSLQDVLDSGKYHPGVKENMETAVKLDVGTPPYNEKIIRQEELRMRILNIMAENDLDAMVYAHQQQLVCKTGGSQKQRNGALCSATGFPSIAVPAGFVPSEEAPLGVPVGMEIMGRPFREDILIEIAYAFEQLSQYRQAPDLSLFEN